MFTFEGKAIGSLAGGNCWDAFGSRKTQLGWGLANLTFGFIYLAFHLLRLWTKRQRGRHVTCTQESTIVMLKVPTDAALPNSQHRQ